jgi:CheY-like chemotaxis protein
LGVGRLSRWRYSCTGGRPWVRCKSGISQVATGVVLGEPGFA